MGRPLMGEVPMGVLAIRLLPHDLAALTAYGATMGHKSPGVAARALILEGLDRLRRKHKRAQKGFGADKSYFTK